MQTEWANFTKTYTAVVHGKLEEKEGTISSYLLESTAYKVFSTEDSAKGKLAETGFKVIKETGNFSLLEVQLFTGRKHQIRVHFAEMGHAVAGDKLYGKGKMGIKRLALHATTLTISHPYSKEQLTFEAPIPSYFRVIMKG